VFQKQCVALESKDVIHKLFSVEWVLEFNYG
jgi:hypothetical protein